MNEVPHEPEALESREARKLRALTRARPSTTRSIADAVVIKEGNLSFLSERSGQVPMDREHGLGIYYRDCRFLDGYELMIADSRPLPLVAIAVKGFKAEFELTNPAFSVGDAVVSAEQLGIRWVRIIEGAELTLYERLEFTNYARSDVALPVTLAFRAEFEDVYQVRGLALRWESGQRKPQGEQLRQPGRHRPPEWDGSTLRFSYEGGDGIRRCTEVELSPPPETVAGTLAYYRLPLKQQERHEIHVTIRVFEADHRQGGHRQGGRRERSKPDIRRLEERLSSSAHEEFAGYTLVQTDSVLLNRVLDRSFRDLGILQSYQHGDEFFAAGVPWFVALFGRDSIITALQTLAYDPSIAAQTLRLLATFQGTKVDAWRDEQPGKILHELRVGELAHLDQIPQTPYYGSVDATLLFLILLARHATWTGELALFRELEDNVERALHWIAEYADSDGDGYVDYRTGSTKGLVNQGWKDSGNAIMNEDGSLAEPPIALVEVQGYAYEAKRAIAGLFRRAGKARRAETLEREAADLARRFNHDFWDDELGTFVLALQKGGRPARVVASNPGHALWAGIAEPDKARRTWRRLMQRDMFTGWGIRTLSAKELNYNPVGYHLGTVWPHDNSIIAAGMRRYGFGRVALRIFCGIVGAASHFESQRLPELFSGFRRRDFRVPIRYPVACHPQAWSAGTVPYLLETLLGITPEGFERRLRIGRPILPIGVQRVEIRGLRIANTRVDLRFEHSPSGVQVETLRLDGPLDVVVE